MFAILALAIVWRLWQATSSTPITPGGPGGGGARAVGVAAASLQRVQFEYEVVGNVESLQTVEIVARTPGILESVTVHPGDRVTNGQLLAKIDDSQVLNEVLRARSALANAEFTYFQLLSQRELTDVQVGSGVATARANLQAAEAGVERSLAVYDATLTEGETSIAQAEAALEGAQASLRQAEVDYQQASVRYERMEGLQAQGFASYADVQDAYNAVLSAYAAAEAQQAIVRAARSEVANAREQARAATTTAQAEIETSRLSAVSSDATLTEAEAATSRTEAFQQQLLAQQSLVEAARAEHALAELRLAETELRSPVDGYVSDRRLDPGAVTSVGTPILTVQAEGSVRVVASLPQEVYRYIVPGRPCVVRIDGLRDEAFEAEVTSKDSAVDAASRQFNVRIGLEDPEGRVRPGMFARVEFWLGPQDPRLTVPSNALYEKNSSERTATVYKVVDGTVQVRRVEYGLSDNEKTAIRSGIEEGEQVVVQSPGALRDGQEVQVSNPSALQPGEDSETAERVVRPGTPSPTPTPTTMDGGAQ